MQQRTSYLKESFKEVYGEGSLSLLDNAEVTFVMYNKTEEKLIGKKRVQVVNPRNGRKYSVEFVVVKGNGKPLLGLRASEQRQLISVVRQNIMAIQPEEPSQSKTPLTTESIFKEYADVFRGEGKLEGDLHLEIDPNVPPVQLPTRKVPIAIKEKLKEELDRLESINVIKAHLFDQSFCFAFVTVKIRKHRRKSMSRGNRSEGQRRTAFQQLRRSPIEKSVPKHYTVIFTFS